MQKVTAIIFLSWLVTACATVPLEGLYTDIDAASWEVGFQRDFGPGIGYIREFVPTGESINHWSKLLSIEFIEGETRSVTAYLDDFQQKRKQQCPGTLFTLLKEDEYATTYHFSFPDCGDHQQQTEISRMYLGNDGLHRLSYAEKGNHLSESTIQHWIKAFDQSYIVKGSAKIPIR